MNRLLAASAIAALALCGASAASAQDTGDQPATSATPATPADPGTSAATPATPPEQAEAPSAAASGANASVTMGMDVKDNTGAKIGTVSDVKTDASGKQMATINMGADSFQVDTSRLAVEGGAATVNATADEIRQMLKK
jgi:hypothetical protein